MYNALYAELLKLRRHTATWLLVWIYPIAVALLNVLLIGHDIFGAPLPAKAPLLAPAWIERSAAVLSVPLAAQGRWLIAGFAAVAFAGEYGWNTWKLVIPARERWQLIVSKWVVVTALLYIALILADLIMLGGAWIRSVSGGEAIPAGVTAQAISANHIEALADTTVPIIYTIAWAGFLAVLTRSMLATAISSIVVVSLEQAHALLAMLASGWAAGLTRFLLEVLPLYHVANVTTHLKGERPLVVPLSDGVYGAHWQISLAVVLAWISGLGVLTLLSFRRQDMN